MGYNLGSSLTSFSAITHWRGVHTRRRNGHSAPNRTVTLLLALSINNAANLDAEHHMGFNGKPKKLTIVGRYTWTQKCSDPFIQSQAVRQWICHLLLKCRELIRQKTTISKSKSSVEAIKLMKTSWKTKGLNKNERASKKYTVFPILASRSCPHWFNSFVSGAEHFSDIWTRMTWIRLVHRWLMHFPGYL